MSFSYICTFMLRLRYIFIVLFLIAFNVLYASRPTVAASNLTYSNLQCTSVQLNWTNGNGAGRLIVGREGAAPTFKPSDNNYYPSDNSFGGSPNLGSGNFIVYNSIGTSLVTIDSLKQNTTYYFEIFEHDNSGSSTQYLTSSSVSISIKTYYLNLSFSIQYVDSCQYHNEFKFTNNSTTDIPGLIYTWNLNDGNTSNANSFTHKYATKSGKIPVTLSGSPALGCPGSKTESVRVYPKKNAYIDYNSFKDTQCLDGNYFQVDPLPIASPPGLSYSFSYKWVFGDGTIDTSFRKMKKSYKVAGNYNVQMELTLNFTPPAGGQPQKSGCKDTLIIPIVVLPNPVGSATISDSIACFKNNSFQFSNTDNSLTYYKWYFGDGDSSAQQTISHSFKDTGVYNAIHIAYANTGCKGKDTIKIRVIPNVDATFGGLDTFYCLNNNTVNLYANDSSGSFSGYSMSSAFSLIPNQAGNQQLSYIVSNNWCSDTTSKSFRVQSLPQPQLGNDTAICSGGSFLLNANTNGRYLWNTGDTSKIIFVNKTGTYIVKVNNNNCINYDSVSVVFSTIPKIELGRDTIICKGATVRLNARSFNATYLWNDGSKDSVNYATQQGKYLVVVQNACGRTEDSIFITVQNEYCDLFMATAFSPDNDLINSVFMPLGRNINVELFQIFNRWGELVFQTTENNVGWNGRLNDKPCEQGQYIWKLFYTVPVGSKFRKSNAFGTIMLLR